VREQAEVLADRDQRRVLVVSFTRSALFTVCQTSATAAAASSLILSASTIVTRGIRTITGSPSSPFSVRVTSSLRQASPNS
jgi:hypothetical protein